MCAQTTTEATAVPLPSAHFRPSILDLVVVLTLTLTLRGGQVTGWPFLQETFSARVDGAPFEAVADDMSSRLEHLTAQLQAQGAQITDIGTQLAKLTQSASFTVTFSGRDIGDLTEGQTLKFDKVLFNTGNGYNPKTGFFTAPSAGLYAFNIQVSRHPSDPSSCVEVELVHSVMQQSHSAPSTQQQSVSPLPDYHHHHHQPTSALRPKQQTITTVLMCVQGNNATSSRALVRLAQGDRLHARISSGSMLLGDAFTSLSGLKLPPLSPLFGPLLR